VTTVQRRKISSARRSGPGSFVAIQHTVVAWGAGAACAERSSARVEALGGGVATVRQYLAAGLIDEIHLAIGPVLLGRGEHLLAGIDTVSLGYKCTEHASTDDATHVVLTK
jgi:dihydrofolate reductase